MEINDTFPHLLLKVLRRKIFPAFFTPYQVPKLNLLEDLDESNELVYQKLISDYPCMICRYGSYELHSVINYRYVSGEFKHNILDYIKGKGWEWWWNETTLKSMTSNAGFWPSTHENIEKYAQLTISDSELADVVGSFTGLEWYLRDKLSNATFIPFFNLEPFFSHNPWTRALEGKKVLVVHPFAETIVKQYSNYRTRIFQNQQLLPEFDLQVLKSVQSLGGNSDYKDWFDALLYMEQEIGKREFDIAIIGCGAYGFNLAAFIKRMEKKAIHLGGATQLLFGIRGHRWEKENQSWYVNGNYPDLMNEYWCRPVSNEITNNLKNVENACYT